MALDADQIYPIQSDSAVQFHLIERRIDMQISPMTSQQVPEVIALWEATEGLILTYSDNPTDLARYFADNPKMSHIATDSGRVVGAVLCGHDGRRGYLHHLAVAPKFRGQGVGRSLANSCLTRLQAVGILQCNLFVLDDNELGKQFWENDSWSEWPNIRLMSKKLADG